jgi:hypothetical protein
LLVAFADHICMVFVLYVYIVYLTPKLYEYILNEFDIHCLRIKIVPYIHPQWMMWKLSEIECGRLSDSTQNARKFGVVFEWQ